MTLDARLNKIVSEQHVSKRDFAKRIGLAFGYNPQWILNGDSEYHSNSSYLTCALRSERAVTTEIVTALIL